MGTKNKKKTAEDKCLAARQTLSILFNTKIKELPEDFYTSVKIGDYYMYVNTVYDMPPILYVEKKDGCGMGTTIKFSNPDPNLTVGELFERAKALIESINSSCSRP
jgi:hypothetical protein